MYRRRVYFRNLGHTAYINPTLTVQAMDAIVDGWAYGRRAKNLNFGRWEDEIDTPLALLRERMNLDSEPLAA